MQHLNCITSSNTLHASHEPPALDVLETRFFDRCRRNSGHVSYPRHIPVPEPITNFQRRGLTYRSATGPHAGTPLPVLGDAISLASTTCPISGQETFAQDVIHRVLGQRLIRQPFLFQATRGYTMANYEPTASRKQRQDSRRELNTVHRQNLQRLLQRRMEAARANGNETLLQQLEQEMNLIS